MSPNPIRVLVSGAGTSLVRSQLDERPEVEILDSAREADVVIHGMSGASSLEHDLGALRRLTSSPVIIAAVGEVNGLADKAFAAGVADLIVLPQPSESILFAIRKATAKSTAAPRAKGRITTVVSPKGGTGKTVLTVNLASALARAQSRTVVVDLDLQFGDAAMMLGVLTERTIVDLASAAAQLDVEKLRAFATTDVRTGVALLPAPARPEEAQSVRQAELARVLAVARDAYDAIVIDTAPLFDVAMLAALDATDEVILVCTPELPSVKNTRVGLETLARLGVPRERLTLVVNRLGAPSGLQQSDIEHALDTKVDFTLPDDPSVPDAINRAVPAVVARPDSQFVRGVTQLAGRLVGVPALADGAARRRFQLRRAR